MPQQRDLNRTRERIMAAAQKEFAAHGFAGARTDAIARRARVNERMIFYCFDSKEGLYRAVLAQKLSAETSMIESTPDEDFTSSLVKGFGKNSGILPPDADEEMLLLVRAALCTFPLALSQVTSLVTGMDPLDPVFRRKWSACMEWIGQRLFTRTLTRGDELEREKADDSAGQNRGPSKTRPQPDATRRAKREQERSADEEAGNQGANE